MIIALNIFHIGTYWSYYLIATLFLETIIIETVWSFERTCNTCSFDMLVALHPTANIFVTHNQFKELNSVDMAIESRLRHLNMFSLNNVVLRFFYELIG